ncbi:GNAT family N-acetyltransferase [Paenibacillus oenotherae]|uniref:GNAT family N-acetyltransferase n=1 Tax=Paenibacillus oenotherae TaxID=1435645 RepID=A0ABS7D449_9BACL|nr:GNAT family protein [Paenibacillus oenotherae]MBW7474710.1 GNAT family N-acetyltransferase [Paenibacillus oenotherae]
MNEIFSQFPVLESKHIVLKQVEDHHLDDLFNIYSNDRVFQYCGIIPKHNKAAVRNMIGHFERDYKKRSRIKWGIFLQTDSDRLVGIIEAFHFNSKVNMVTIGYYLEESYWGQGIASQALEVLVSFLFDTAGFNRIQAEVMPPNETSKRVLLKNGFLREGLLRQAELWSGKGVVDLEIYGILKADYMQSRAQQG